MGLPNLQSGHAINNVFVGSEECLQAERKYFYTIFRIPRTVGFYDMNYRPHSQTKF
jgi:hypothetical protein